MGEIPSVKRQNGMFAIFLEPRRDRDYPGEMSGEIYSIALAGARNGAVPSPDSNNDKIRWGARWRTDNSPMRKFDSSRC
jgi:hypothetical protein